MIRLALKHYLIWHAQKVQASMHEPLEAQKNTFARLKASFTQSELASQTGFNRCRSLEDCRSLPILDGETMQPLFNRILAGGVSESRVLGDSRIIGFARTSGTHGANKDIPLNQAYLASLDRTLLRLMASHFYTTGAWNTLLVGKNLLLGSRPVIGASPTGLPISDISGLLPTRTWRSLRRLHYLPHYKDLWIQDWPTKIEKILDQAHGKDIRSITGLPALAMDFARRAKTKYGVGHLSELWPNLRMYVYGGVTFPEEQRREMLKMWFTSKHELSFVETYFATEGQLAFSFEPNQPGLALNTLENLYLFYPYPLEGGPLLSHEIKLGKSYSIHITTPGGLINYHMGDRIEVVSERPLRIRFCGREKDEISMTGEKLSLEQIDLAWDASGLGALCSKLYRPVVWVEQGEKPYLAWGVPDAGAGLNATKLDEALCRFNTLYAEALVQEKVIGESRLVPMPISVLDHYTNSRLGIAQLKPKRIFNSRADFTAAYGWQPA